MKKIKYIQLLLIVIFFASCYNEENISHEEVQQPYEMKDSDDPLDHEIFQIYEKYRTIVLYDFDKKEYEWKMVKSPSELPSNKVFVLQEDKKIVKAAVDFLKTEFFDIYGDVLDKKHLPFKLLLFSEIYETVEEWGIVTRTDFPTHSGMNFMGISGFDANFLTKTAEEKNEIKKKLHADFWGEYLYKNDRVGVDEEFFTFSEEQYNMRVDDDPVKRQEQLYERGFFDAQLYISYGFPEYYGPTPEGDLGSFFGNIVTTPYTSLQPILEKYPLMKKKYDLLTANVKKKYNIDLQAIGDSTVK
ncbi:MAG: hypothetical protein N4A49_10420 [Marinifilaceae bacterium]|nr:hypothetical protein [Marinifilaceae bacterium]